MDKVEYESRFDGKWVLTTNMDLSADKVAVPLTIREVT